MKNKILLIQFRDDISVDQELDSIKKIIAAPNDRLKVINAIKDDFEDDPESILEDVSCVITGPSGQYDITKMPEPIKKAIKKTENIFSYIIENDVPLLAICFGHQFLAHKLGGTVEADPSIAETGTLNISLTPLGRNSVIYDSVPNEFAAVVGHKDSVTKLPDGAELLASTKNCPIHSYRYKNNIYGVQFHPELDLDGLMWRLSFYPEYLKGQTLEEYRQNFVEVDESHRVINNFITHYAQ